VITGIAVFVGAMSVTATVAEVNMAPEEPTPFVATTEVLMKYPTSESETTYVLFVAEAIFE
jgi:hypothetical protein